MGAETHSTLPPHVDFNSLPDPAKPTLHAGQVDEGQQLEIHGRIDGGPYSEVFHATDRTTGDEVVLKLLHEPNEYIQQLADNELNASAIMNGYPGFTPLRGAGITETIDGEFRHMVLRYARHGMLQDHIAETSANPDLVVGMARQLAPVIAHAHANGIVHRDIKPQNVMRTDEGWELTDFGLAVSTDELTPAEKVQQRVTALLMPKKQTLVFIGGRHVAYDASQKTSSGLQIATLIDAEGTVGFIPHENFAQSPAPPAAPSGDMYSFSNTLYVAATGEFPFKFKDLRGYIEAGRTSRPMKAAAANPKVSYVFSELLYDAMGPAKDRPDADEFQASLLAV